MTIDEIERRLRLPAPDELTVLPALLLPVRVETAPLPDRTLGLRLGRQRRPVPLVLLGTALLLVGALVGALLVGAFRIEQLRDALPIPGLYTGRGMTLDYPDDWTRLTPHDPFRGGGSWVTVIVGNRDVQGCEADSTAVERNSPPPQPTPDADDSINGDYQRGVIVDVEDRIYACLTEQALEPGEVRVVVSRGRPQAILMGPIGDFQGSWLAPNPEIGGPVYVNAENGFTETVGKMPAQLIVRGRSVVPGAEQLRTWLVAIPRSADALWWIQAVMRGPDLPALEAQVDAIARSLTFDQVPTPIAEADRDLALGNAIDFVDRMTRDYPGGRFMGCMPRMPGAVTTTIHDSPRGRLAAPLEVTCTTTVEHNDPRVLEAVLEVAWPATGDHAAGRWAIQIVFDGDGFVLQQGEITPGTGEDVAFPGDPSTNALPKGIPTFRPGDLARSVEAGAGSAFYDVDDAMLPPEPRLYPASGALVVILAGPETYDGRDFYFADNGFEVGWVGAEAAGGAVLAPAEPWCPAVIDATELAYLSSLERRSCVTGEITLGPVQAALPNHDQGQSEALVDPAWLAAEPRWRLYGTSGADGLDVGLPVALGPHLSDLPTDGWLTVTGHFDDPASATCSVTYPEAWGVEEPPRDAQIRRCLERFVVTSATTTEGPR